ncbi:hypothetical protein AX16_007227 [Volvariella volvacea WC 439]|nr:hypothetical protein AX16_007227 [Volvariella volvacea WC 439]
MSSPHLPPAAPPASIPITDGIPPATIGHLALFNQNLQKANRQVEWVYSDGSSDQRRRSHTSGSISHKGAALGPVGKVSKTTPIWSVKVLVDGEFYGQGKGSTKKAARNEAAKEGLERLGVHVW